MGYWHSLTTAIQRARFAEVMRLMDRRYCGLSSDELRRWLAHKKKIGKNPELFGWYPEAVATPGSLRQVMAITSVKDHTGHRTDIGLSMLGVAADVISEDEWTDRDIRRWLTRFVIGIKHLNGLDARFGAIRPKTMTWKPMERMHELMKQGIRLPSDDLEEGILHSGVFQEKDLGDSLYWKMRTVSVKEKAPQPIGTHDITVN